MRIVLDTNVVVAGLVAQGLCHEIIEIYLPEHQAVLSPALWTELLEVLKKKFDLSPEDLPFLDLYRRHAIFVEPRQPSSRVSRDPDDDWVLATAKTGDAELIITGDNDLLVLQSFQGIAILSPRDFVALRPKDGVERT